MRRVFIFLSFCLTILCCKQETKTVRNAQCSKEQRIDIINSILNTKNVKSYLHLDLIERHPIKIIRSGFTSDITSFNFGENGIVEIVDSIPSQKSNLTLKVLIDSCNQKSGRFMFYSPIENAEVNGTITQKDSIWEIAVLHDIEF